jgi:hypothetical protein
MSQGGVQSSSLKENAQMDIVRNADGTLVVPLQQERRHQSDDAAQTPPSTLMAKSRRPHPNRRPASCIRARAGMTRPLPSGITSKTPIVNPSYRPQAVANKP